MKNISVIGVGRVGLPLSLAFASKDCNVIGIDIDQQKVSRLNKGEMPFLEKGATDLLKKHINKNLEFVVDVEYGVKKSDAIILTLGTPVDENLNPIFSDIEKVTNQVLPHFRENQLYVLRSTVAPGSTEYLKRFIEKNSDFAIGENLFLSCCPERIAEGKALEELFELPQIIGAFDEKSHQFSEELFKHLTPKITHAHPTDAELSKLFSNMYRYIDFAIGNEFMILAQQYGRQIYDILPLVNKGYKRRGLKAPGFTAGPCLYKDGHILVGRNPFTGLTSLAFKVNECVPAYLVGLIKQRRQIEDAKVAILGLSFKKDIDDPRNSLSYKLKKILQTEGAKISLHDPYIQPGELKDVVKDAEIVFLGVNHNVYKKQCNPKFFRKYASKDCLVCDVWNMFKTNKIIFSLEDLV